MCNSWEKWKIIFTIWHSVSCHILRSFTTSVKSKVTFWCHSEITWLAVDSSWHSLQISWKKPWQFSKTFFFEILWCKQKHVCERKEEKIVFLLSYDITRNVSKISLSFQSVFHVLDTFHTSCLPLLKSSIRDVWQDLKWAPGFCNISSQVFILNYCSNWVSLSFPCSCISSFNLKFLSSFSSLFFFQKGTSSPFRDPLPQSQA